VWIRFYFLKYLHALKDICRLTIGGVWSSWNTVTSLIPHKFLRLHVSEHTNWFRLCEYIQGIWTRFILFSTYNSQLTNSGYLQSTMREDLILVLNSLLFSVPKYAACTNKWSKATYDYIIVSKKSKAVPLRHTDAKGKIKYSSYSFLTSALGEWVVSVTPWPRFTPGERTTICIE
jgi:hypothetical protein